MVWYQYLMAFLGGAVVANFVPHFVHGVSGDAFPTPFAKPPGKGLSSPTVNVVWALFNLVVGYALCWFSGFSCRPSYGLLAFLAGVAAISVPMSAEFAKKQKPGS